MSSKLFFIKTTEKVLKISLKSLQAEKAIKRCFFKLLCERQLFVMNLIYFIVMKKMLKNTQK